MAKQFKFDPREVAALKDRMEREYLSLNVQDATTLLEFIAKLRTVAETAEVGLSLATQKLQAISKYLNEHPDGMVSLADLKGILYAKVGELDGK